MDGAVNTWGDPSLERYRQALWVKRTTSKLHHLDDSFSIGNDNSRGMCMPPVRPTPSPALASSNSWGACALAAKPLQEHASKSDGCSKRLMSNCERSGTTWLWKHVDEPTREKCIWVNWKLWNIRQDLRKARCRGTPSPVARSPR